MFALILIVVVCFVVGVGFLISGTSKLTALSKQDKEHSATVDSNKKQLLEVEFPQKGFTPTSTYYQYGDGTLRKEYTMFVDSKSKKIAFVYAFKDVKYLNFSEIRSCEIVVMEGSTKINPNLLDYGATSSTPISKLLINITTTNIDDPLLSIDVLRTEGRENIFLTKSSPEYKKSVEFTSKVKSVIDNIVSA